ncbi:endo-1,4-beta-xylanase [Halomicrobium urmianum]|uniref:endo-1,4-beta-xylanase n=1 Tax=Halomicrobium urmianum TaxID=1586233 RepID=UPI0021E6447F|nr:endo-1,4-beta-xylanase [Halomicrobium urmianum]
MTRNHRPDGAESPTNEERRWGGDRLGSVDRRDYLRTLGAIGTTGLLGSTAVSSAAAQSGFDEAAADQRIRENQTGPLTVEVVDENGDPVSDADVEVEMTEHDFGWGNMVNVDNLLNRFGEGSDYYRHLRELFNTAVLENAHKWAIWEGDTQTADDAVDWLDENGFRIRGHTCVYGVEYATERRPDGRRQRRRAVRPRSDDAADRGRHHPLRGHDPGVGRRQRGGPPRPPPGGRLSR